MTGGLGNDTYYIDNASDTVTELANEGTDAVAYTSYTSAVTVSLATNSGLTNIENLTGSQYNDSLTGNSGNNVLNGYLGADSMTGGLGNDTYYIDNAGDTVTELANEGADSIAYTSYTSAVTINLAATGTAVTNGAGAFNAANIEYLTGSQYNDNLTGNSGNNILNGYTGADTMAGGLGDDTYIVDNASDIVNESNNQGTDVIQASVSYSLSGRYVETLVLTGTAAINGTGHEFANTLVGNSAANTLNGGAGADSLNGGLGNDTYIMARGYGLDSITDLDSAAGNLDRLNFAANIAADQLWFSQSGNDLKVNIIGTADSALIKNWYSSANNHVERLHSGNGKTLTDANVQNLVNAMAGMTPPPMGQTTLTAQQHAQLDGVINANWV